MKKNILYIFITAYLALLIQTPGRFVYGMTIMIELFLLILIGTLSISLIKKIKLDEIKSFVLMTILISFTVLFRQILAITYSEIALTLGYIIYFPTLSIFLLNNLSISESKNLKDRLLSNLKGSFFLLIAALFFFLFRDIAGYGTFTFFGKNHNLYEKVLLKTNEIGIFSFVASIPGALIMSGLLLILISFILKKFKIIKNVEQQQ